MMKISVVMTTYNGEKYIEDQLTSIIKQSRQPDEVIIYDDSSTDKTVELVNNFIRDHALENWSFYINHINLGWKDNFFEASKKATGDIIFFSDQDDVWKEDKIEIMSFAMEKYGMGALYGEKDFIDQNNMEHPERNEKRKFSGKIEQISLSKSFYTIKTLGCCMCVSRFVLDKYLELGFPEGGHDSQCGRIAILYSSLWHIDIPVINYRVHRNNTSGISADVSFGASSLNKRVEELNQQIIWIDKLLSDKGFPKLKRSLVEKCDVAINKRIEYLEGNYKISFVHLLFLRHYYANLTMLIGDFAYKNGFNKNMGKIRWIVRK